MKKIFITTILILLAITLSYSRIMFDHSHLNGKWYAYAYVQNEYKEDGTPIKVTKSFREGVLFLEFVGLTKIKLHILDSTGSGTDILFSERILYEGTYHTHIRLKESGQSLLIKEDIPTKGLATLEVLKGNFPLVYFIDYRVLLSKTENYFNKKMAESMKKE